MKLGFVLPPDTAPHALRELVELAEALEYDSIWAGESYGPDALTPLAWAGAITSRARLGTGIMQMAARTPAATAMAARSMQQLTSGRFVLGLGLSSAAVVEDWHGQPFGPSPLRRTREYVAIVRAALAGERLDFDGRDYRLPNPAPARVDDARPMRALAAGVVDVPILLAALGPKNVELACTIGDGWLSVFFSPRRWGTAYDARLLENAGETFEVVPSVAVAVGDDLAGCLDELRPEIAFYVGGMGTTKKNFYFDLLCEYGYTEAAVRIRERFSEGDRQGAIGAVPDALVDDLTIAGPPERVRDRLVEWSESPVTTLALRATDAAALRVCREAGVAS